MSKKILVVLLFILIAIPVFAVTAPAENSNISIFKAYEGMQQRAIALNAMMADENLKKKLDAKIDALIKDKNFSGYYYLVHSSDNRAKKCKQLEQDYVNEAAREGLTGNFSKISVLQAYMKKSPNGAFMGSFIKVLVDRFTYDTKTAEPAIAEKLKAQLVILRKLRQKWNVMKNKNVISKILMVKINLPFEEFMAWFEEDINVSVSDKNQIGNANHDVKVDLNKATSVQLNALPGFTKPLATHINAFTKKYGGFNTYMDFANIVFSFYMKNNVEKQAALKKTFGLIDEIKPLTYLSELTMYKKKWTCMIFINADNDLERFGLDDINEMEKVGSNSDVNIVVQIDRHKDVVNDKRNDIYSVNDGNWNGTRRYYIEKDNNDQSIGSELKVKLGETDAGSIQSMIEFMRWGVKSYPAERYYTIIWNHGAGLHGISNDAQSGNKMTAASLRKLTRIGSELMGKKMDILQFDACLMGTIEIASQIKAYVDVMIGSEELEPGQGLCYTDVLNVLTGKPDISTDEFSRLIVQLYTRSYAKDGSQYYNSTRSVTLSAIKLERLDNLIQPLNNLANTLMDNFNDFVQSVQKDFRFKCRTYGTDMFDMIDLTLFLSSRTGNSAISRAAQDVIDAYGYPIHQRKRVKQFDGPVRIIAPKGSVVRWGINGFYKPDENFKLPAGTNVEGDFALTTISEKGDDGKFGMFLTDLPDYVTYIYYQIKTPGRKIFNKVKVASRKDFFFTFAFPATSPILAEGHTAGMEFSYGLSINFGIEDYPLKKYKRLEFAKDSTWDELLGFKGQFEKRSNVLIVADCGNEYRNDLHLKYYQEMLKGVEYDVFNSRYYGRLTEDIMNEYKDGVIIVFCGYNSDMGTITDVKYSNSGKPIKSKMHFYNPSSLVHYLDNGGQLLLSGHDMEKDPDAQTLFKKWLRIGHFGTEKEPSARLKGTDSTVGTNDISMPMKNINNKYRVPKGANLKQLGKEATPIFKYGDGDVAGVRVERHGYKAVYLGFEFESLYKKDQKVLVKKFINYLLK